MATKVLLPKQGLQMTEGIIVAWLKKAGEAISRGEPLVEIETDKATIQIESPVDGVVLAVLFQEGDTVPVASTIAFVGERGEVVPKDQEARELAAVAAAPEPPAKPTVQATAAPAAASTAAATAGPSVLQATPRARMTASERHVDLHGIRGSGPDGLVIERDVIRAAAAAPAAPGAPAAQMRPAPEAARPQVPAPPAPVAAGVLAPLSSMRKTIARRMKESLAVAAQASHQVDLDCTEMVRLREDLKQRKVDISYTDVIVKAVATALRQHPLMNSSWTDDGILMRAQVNVGVAVALDDGLIVPVIRDADVSSLLSIHARTRELIDKARTGSLRGEDLEGAGFTVTNLGMYEIDRFTAIIDQPQTGILAVGRIAQKPAAVGQTVQVRPQMTVTLSYDHRVIDGAPAARFLQTVRQLLESPCLMM